MAQAPETAKFDSMPRSAIAGAPMDAVLPPEGLAERVLLITRGKAGRMANGQLIGVVSTKPALQRLFEGMYTRFGVDFAHYKLPTMMRRIERRMAVLGCTSVSDFADIVAKSDEECELLRQEFLIPVTSFFRDTSALEALAETLRAQLREHPAQQPFRIWCAGCATGEEAWPSWPWRPAMRSSAGRASRSLPPTWTPACWRWAARASTRRVPLMA